MDQHEGAVARSSYSSAGKRKRIWHKPWISAQTLALVEKKRLARRHNDKTLYRELASETQRSLRKDINEWLSAECENIGEYNRFRKSKELFEEVKQVKIRKFKSQQACIKDEHENVITTPEETLKRWQQNVL
eukprot:gene13181-3982_t